MSHEPPLTLTANYQLTEADLVAALRYRRWGDPVARRRFFLRWAGCVVASVLLAVVLWRFLGENAGVSIAIPLVAITMMWPFALWNQPKATAQQLSKLPGVLDPSWITVTPDALVVPPGLRPPGSGTRCPRSVPPGSPR
ncbi:MAG: hypothetical protein K0Q72_5340 [Armatimonadetes bacterium]|nr:hypothetical protein [Armatimonadota bacterium]